MSEDAFAATSTPPASASHAVRDGGEIYSWQPRGDVIVSRIVGALNIELAICFEEYYLPIIARTPKVRVFVDLEAVSVYTREARERMTAFALAHIAQIESIHVLVRSKLVALGLGAFKHAVGDALVRSYFDRESFLRSLSVATASGR